MQDQNDSISNASSLPPFKCGCGEIFTSKFCPGCGAQRKEENTFTCDCGYTGPALNFCPDCGRKISDNTAPAAPAVPEQEPDAGPEIPNNAVILFSMSTFSSANPPVTISSIVYEYSDTQLLFDNNGQRRLISADVIEPAMEIIRRNGLDDPNFKKPTGVMGGSVYVSFKNGDSYIHTSLQEQGYAVSAAKSELMALFNNAQE